MIVVDRKEYVAKCRMRWAGPYLRDALGNYRDFVELGDTLVEELKRFKRDPWQKDMAGNCHNSDGTLTGFLWGLQGSLQKDQSSLYPLLDFCEGTQRIHLRRGLIYFCELALKQMERAQEFGEDQLVLEAVLA